MTRFKTITGEPHYFGNETPSPWSIEAQLEKLASEHWQILDVHSFTPVTTNTQQTVRYTVLLSRDEV